MPRSFFSSARHIATRARLAIPAAGFLAFSAPLPASAATAKPVKVCLALVSDASSSVSGEKGHAAAAENWSAGRLRRERAEDAWAKGTPLQDEYGLMRDGTGRALKSGPVVQEIQATGGIGVIAIDFSYMALVTFPYEELRTRAQIESYADRYMKHEREMAGSTSIGTAIGVAQYELEKHCPSEAHKIIDVAGDGASNSGYPSIEDARKAAIAAGITVNGLAILNPGPLGQPDIVETYKATVKTPDGFVISVRGYESFELAMIRKLALEISDNMPGRPFRFPFVHYAAGLPPKPEGIGG